MTPNKITWTVGWALFWAGYIFLVIVFGGLASATGRDGHPFYSSVAISLLFFTGPIIFPSIIWKVSQYLKDQKPFLAALVDFVKFALPFFLGVLILVFAALFKW